MTKISLQSILTLTSFGLVAVAGGTSAAAPGKAPSHPASPGQASIAAKAPEGDTTVHGGVQMLGDALGEVSLRPDQADAIAELGLAVAPYERGVDQAESDLLSTLAQQVREGHVDRAAIQPEIDAYVTARQRFAAPFRGALVMLHLILDPEQRGNFADALEARVHDVVSTELSHDRLDAFDEALGADEAQRAQVEEAFAQIVPTIETERQAVHAAIEGFRADDFSLDEYLPESDVQARARLRADLIGNATDEIVGVLDPDQRDMLAARIEGAARVGEPPRQPEPLTPPEQAGASHTGEAGQHVWVAGFGRGPWGRRGVVVAGSRAWYGARVGAFPIAAGWGMGW